MYVKMKDGLARARAHVQHSSVSMFNVALPRNLGGGQVTTADYFGVLSLRFL
jgi:hypothetical protein